MTDNTPVNNTTEITAEKRGLLKSRIEIMQLADGFRNSGDLKWDWYLIPENIRESIFNYVEHGWVPGGFVSAVIACDLIRAVSSADYKNVKLIPVITTFVHMNDGFPAAAIGSYNKLDAWCGGKDVVEEAVAEFSTGLSTAMNKNAVEVVDTWANGV